ncbi:hypothetical protein FPV67DRAFT_1681221 [Lyophyllum atratum]|nr:hypothetical protein FPV67DRAFT_1681221 [Lyophyllum atratum]
MLFKVPIGKLRQYSEPLDKILSIPPSFATEGTECNPIVLHGLTVEEFESFLMWVNHINWSALDLTEVQLSNIFKCCRLWEIQPGIDFAIHGIEKLNLSPSRMIKLGITFQISSWIRAAITTLIDTRLAVVNFSELVDIGLVASAAIAKAREMLEEDRKILVVVPPPMPATSPLMCASHNNCIRSWNEIWVRKISREIVHPFTPLPLERIVDRVEEVDYPHMRQACKESAIQGMRTSKMLEGKGEVVDKAVETVLKHYGLV